MYLKIYLKIFKKKIKKLASSGIVLPTFLVRLGLQLLASSGTVLLTFLVCLGSNFWPFCWHSYVYFSGPLANNALDIHHETAHWINILLLFCSCMCVGLPSGADISISCTNLAGEMVCQPLVEELLQQHQYSSVQQL